MTFLALIHPSTSSIELEAFEITRSGACSSPFSTVQKTTRPSSSDPFFLESYRGSGALTAFSRASYSNLSACTSSSLIASTSSVQLLGPSSTSSSSLGNGSCKDRLGHSMIPSGRPWILLQRNSIVLHRLHSRCRCTLPD